MLERVPPIGDTGREGICITQLLQDTLAYALIVIDEREEVVACTQGAEHFVDSLQTSNSSETRRALPTALQDIVKESLRTQRRLNSRWVTRISGAGGLPIAVRTELLQRQGGGTWVIIVLSEPSVALELEPRLQRLHRLASSGLLSASLAHEIKNTLVAIKTFVDTLVEKHRDEEMAHVAARELDRIQTIVSQMLHFSGTSPATRAHLRLHEILDQTLRLVQHQADEKAVVIQRGFSATVDAVSGDTYQLEQAFMNLFLNALAAMEEGGVLRVFTENIPARPNARIRVVIVDSGSGIPPDVLERVFEPFFTTKPDGTGLGLSITRQIVHEHGGHISVESKPGAGTRFTVDVPVAGSEVRTEAQ